MKRITAFAAAILLLGSSFFVSCKKESQSDIPEPVRKVQKAATVANVSCEDPANPDNPYDQIGYYHNEGVTYVLNITGNSNPVASSEIAALSNQYGLQTFNINGTATAADIDEVVNDGINEYTSIIDQYSVSDKARAYLYQLMAIFDDPSETDEVEYCPLKDRIVALESTVLQDGTLNNTERRQVLSATSVARYSLYYWMNYDFPSDNTARLPKWLKNLWNNYVKPVAKADGIAAATGVIKGHDDAEVITDAISSSVAKLIDILFP